MTQIMTLIYSLCVILRNLWIIEFMYLPKSRDAPAGENLISELDMGRFVLTLENFDK
jgi:hypothetical protein